MIFQIFDQPEQFSQSADPRPIAVGAAVEWAKGQGILTDADSENNISALFTLLGDWTALYAISMNIDRLGVTEGWIGANRGDVAIPRLLSDPSTVNTVLNTYDMVAWRATGKSSLTTDTGLTDAMLHAIGAAHGEAAAICTQSLLQIPVVHPIGSCFAMKRYHFTTCCAWCWDVLRYLLELSTKEPELCGFNLCEPGNLASMSQHLVAAYALVNELKLIFVNDVDYGSVMQPAQGGPTSSLDLDMPGPVLE